MIHRGWSNLFQPRVPVFQEEEHKSMKRFFLCLMCLWLGLVPALGEQILAEGALVPQYEVPKEVTWVLDAARKELGNGEAKNHTTKYGAWAGNPAAEWCAEFLCWCVDQVDSTQKTKLLNRQFPNYTGTNTGRDWFLSQGRYVARRGVVRGWGTQWFKGENEPMAPNSYVPQPGDWMFLSNAATWDTTHVAMVEYCAYDENGKIQVHVIEGNSPFAQVKDQVVRNQYPIDYWAILGYGTVHDVADIAMHFGNSGEKVKALQQDLAAAGLFPQGQKVTGQYGAITEKCVKDIQRQMGAVETGIADQAVQLQLKKLVYAQSADNPENWVDQK